MLQCLQASVVLADKPLLAPTTVGFAAGRLCAILGPNGAGKSTLLSLLSGQRRPSSGSVQLDDAPLAQAGAPELALRRAVMPQESAVAFEFTVQEVVELGRYPHRRQPSADETGIVARALQSTAVDHLAGRVFNTLSGGEKARVHLARVLAQIWEPRPDGRARWLLLDEPTAALDLAHQHLALRLLRTWAHQQGVGVVAVLHDINLALRYADDVLVLGAGETDAFGAAEQLLTQVRVARVWGLPSTPVRGGDGVLQYLFA